jgi:MATE family multidrug resistance protein
VSFFGGLLLIFGAGSLKPLGLFGAGLASTLASGTMFVTLLSAIGRDRKLARYRLLGTPWTPNSTLLERLFRLGGPISVTLVVEIGIFNFAALLIGRVAPDWLAAHAVAAQVVSLLFMVPMGLAQAASVRVGLGVGRGDRGAISATGRAALGIALVYATATASLIFIVRNGLAALFIGAGGPDDLAAQRATGVLLLIVGAMQFADNLQGTLIGLLRGLQDSFVPMLLAVVGFWIIGIGGATVLGSMLGLGAPGVWLGLFAGLTATAVFYGARWRRLTKLEA